MPPAIHSTMTASAVGRGGGVPAWEDPHAGTGSRPTSADTVAAAVAPMNPRREIRDAMRDTSLVITRAPSPDELKFRRHRQRPQQIREAVRRRPVAAR